MGGYPVGASAPAGPSRRPESLDRPPVGISGLSAGGRSAGGYVSHHGEGPNASDQRLLARKSLAQ